MIVMMEATHQSGEVFRLVENEQEMSGLKEYQVWHLLDDSGYKLKFHIESSSLTLQEASYSFTELVRTVIIENKPPALRG